MSVFDGIGTILAALAALAIVLLLAYVALKWMGQKLPTQNASRHIKVLDRMVLGREKYLMLVRVAEKTVLVGVSTNSVEKICEIEDPEAMLEVPAPQGVSFADVLKESLKKGLNSTGTAVKRGRED